MDPMNRVPRHTIKPLSAALLIGLLLATLTGCPPAENPVIIDNQVDSEGGDAGDIDDATNGESEANQSESATDRPDGAACNDDGQCRGGTCLDGDYWHDGHCTSAGCTSDDDCQGDGSFHCIDHPYEGSICVAACEYNADDTDSTCRSDYECRPHDSNQAWCGPDIATSPLVQSVYPPTCVEADQGSVALDFNISDRAHSYFLSTHTGSPGQLDIEYIELPDGARIDFGDINDFQIPQGFPETGRVPLLIPALPDLASQLQAGPHRLVAETTADEVCLHVIEDEQTGQAVDLNIYLVGLEQKDLTFTTATGHPALQSTLAEAEDVLGQAGLSLGEIRFVELPQDIAERFRNLQEAYDFYNLLNFSLSPGPSEDDALSLNAFFVERITFGALGVSAGAPGFAGEHGTRQSGIAVSAEYLGSPQGNDLTATTFAHELSHFLGLNHTTEFDGETSDPIADTPNCIGEDIDYISECPDWGNLMFPSAHANNRGLSDDQGFVLRASPLSK